MTDEATTSGETAATTAAPLPAPASMPASNIPGNPSQTEATVRKLIEDPALGEYILAKVSQGLGKPDEAAEAKALAQRALNEAALYRAQAEYGLTKDDLALIADATPEAILSRASNLAARLKQTAPAGATPPPDTTNGATPPAKAAGVPLPAVPVQPARIEPTSDGLRGALLGMLAENPLPKYDR